MKHLKKFLKDKKEVRIKDLLNSAIGGFETARSAAKLHASMLTNTEKEYCPREAALLLTLKKKSKDQFIGVPMRTTFDEGNDKQWRLNNDWLRDRMVGDWACTSCGATKKFCKAPKGVCDKQGIRCNWEYQEVRFDHPVTMATGGLDALVDVGLTKLRLVECKIMDKDMFRELKAPLAEHRTRTQLYLRLIEESTGPMKEHVDTERATILYILRGFGLKDEDGDISPFREYLVERDDSVTETPIGKAHALTHFRVWPDKGFPGGVCSDTFCKRAKSCSVSAECFSGQYPAAVTWTSGGKPVHDLPIVMDGKTLYEAPE